MNKIELKYGLLNNYSSMKVNLISPINYLLIWTYTDSLNESTGADNNSTITQMRSLETE